MMRRLFHWSAGSSIRRQLIIGVAAVHLILMSIFVYDLTNRQRTFLHEKSYSESAFQIKMFASSAKEHLRTNDLIALQELLETYLDDHEIQYAMVIAPDGKILCHSDESKRGLFLQDSLSLTFLAGPVETRTMLSTETAIDIVHPVLEGKTLLGWVRLVNDLSDNQQQIDVVTRQGFVYTIVAILIGTLFAFALSGTVLRQLNLLMAGTQKLTKLAAIEPIPVITKNEVGIVTKAFNEAIQRISEQDVSVKESETRYRLLAESISDVIWILDANEKNFRYISPSVFHMTGFSAEETLKMSYEMTVTPSSLHRINEQLPERIRNFLNGSSQSFTDVVEQICKDGSTVMVEMKSRFRKNEQSGSIEIFGVSRNVTERQKAEDLLREREGKYRNLVENSAVGVFRSTVQGKILYVNYAIVSMLEFESSGELIMQGSFTRYRYPGQREEILRQLRSSGRVEGFEASLLTKSGNERIVVFNIVITGDVMDGTLIDVTERKKAEIKLQENEEKYRGLVENSPDAIAIYCDGKVVFVNNQCAQLLRVDSTDQLIGRAVIEFVHPDSRKNVIERMEQIAAGRVALPSEEEKFIRGDGTVVDVEVKAIPTMYENRPAVQIIVRDITERRRIESALRESEEVFNQLMEHSPIYVFFKDENIRTTRLSRNFESMIGLPSSEMIGKNMFELFPSDLARSMVEDDKKILEAGKKIEVEEELNGRKYLTIKFPIKIRDKAPYLAGFTIDITDRKNAEEKLNQLSQAIEQSPVSIIITDTQGSIEYVNPKFVEVTGYSALEAMGTVPNILRPDCMTREEHESMWGTVRSGRAWFGEVQNTRKDGTQYWESVKITPIINAQGGISHFLTVMEDITERRRNEQIIRDVQRRESIGVLAGGIAHDFNNLLSVMMGNISLAQSRIDPDHPAMKNIDRAKAAMDRAATLTKQMLAYSGKGKFQVRDIDLVALVQEHINFFEVSLAKNVRLVSNLSPSSVFIKGDPAQIEQIVMNLIINGGEAIENKQGIVSISVSAVSLNREELSAYSMLPNTKLEQGSYALLKVTDNGSGMNKETREKIFEPFFTTKFVGRGLGLSAVLGIIRGNDGGIAIESTEGKGTTFSVILPLIHSSVPDQNASAPAAGPAVAEHRTVLVIDDEKYVVEMTTDILESVGYRHHSALDPEDGIRIFQELWRTIDAVILDFSMPKLNGREVIVELRKINPTVKVVIASGYTEEEIFQLMGKDMPTAFISKPYTQKDLLAAMKKILTSQ